MERIRRIINKKKGFTLIELIVTIAVLGILVLLASPRFFGHTQNAELTKGFANAKSIEKASELYYMDHEDWPRLTDEPYTSEEIESYSERIFDRTGQEVNLDPEGNYYDIDYDKLSDYVQVPDDKKNYILQNPVGKVFYMDNLNETGVARVNYSNVKEEDDNPIPIGEPIDFAYTGKPQSIELGKGTYKLEVWGAQGGSHNNNNGGKGGYSKGLFELNEIRNIHIVVGGQGQGSYGPGGYNGGGMSGDDASDGGGASHIATTNGLLSSLSDNKSSVILVAGGGGGSGRHKDGGRDGGPGGGLVGLSGIGHTEIGDGGTQVAGGNVVNVNSTILRDTNPGEFGQGGYMASHVSFGSKAGGGGGYYGGGPGVAGGGGSSYIGRVQDGKTIPGNQHMPNPNGGIMIGNSGHGFARITRVDYSNVKEENDNPIPIGEPINFAYTGKPQNIGLGKGTYKLEVWGAQGGDGTLEDVSTQEKAEGGKGGYTTGVLTVNNSSVSLFIYTGGAGSSSKISHNGGFNGGGSMLTARDAATGSGGGASDIRLAIDDLYSRIIVAGGGGGAPSLKNGTPDGYVQGGHGGGLVGGDANYSYSSSHKSGPRIGGSGGEQNKGGSGGRYNSSVSNSGQFGTGANWISRESNSYGSGAGGGGWYGGGAGGDGGTGGGGGSGYALTENSHKPSGYNVSEEFYLEDIQLIPGNQSMPNPNGGTMVGNSGHGFARIIRVD